MANILIAGGSGLIGKKLQEYFTTNNHQVFILTRKARNPNEIAWDGKTQGSWTDVLEKCDVLINLSGKNINCRLNRKNSQQILRSRLEPVKVLNKAIEQAKNKPKLFIQSSAVGFYGNSTLKKTENDQGGSDYLARICIKWEKEFLAHRNDPEVRRVVFRIGVVLSSQGGAFKTLATVTRLFAGGHLGNGQQFMSWVHIDDVCKSIQFIIDNESLQGPFNLCSPTPITNKSFMAKLRGVMKRPYSPPVPLALVRPAMCLSNQNYAIAVSNNNCPPHRLLDIGFDFEYTDVEKAFKNLLIS